MEILSKKEIEAIFGAEILVYTQKKEHMSCVMLYDVYMIIKYYNYKNRKMITINKRFYEMRELILFIRTVYEDTAICFDIIPVGKLLLAELYNNNLIMIEEI